MNWLLSIWNYLRSFWQRPAPTELPELFTVREREIYAYFDGQQIVRADPMRLYRRMKDVSTDLEIDFKVARSGMKGSEEAYAKAISRIQSIFNVKSLDQGGLTDVECVALFAHFWNYSGGIKKKLPPPSMPSSETSDATPPSTATAPDAASPTSPTSDSGSTSAEETTTSPTEPPSESESPSA